MPEPVKSKAFKCLDQVVGQKIWPKSLQKAYWERVQAPQALANLALDWEYYPYPCPLATPSTAFARHDHYMTPFYGKINAIILLEKQYLELTKHALVDVDHLFSVSQSTKDF